MNIRSLACLTVRRLSFTIFHYRSGSRLSHTVRVDMLFFRHTLDGAVTIVTDRESNPGSRLRYSTLRILYHHNFYR